MIECLLVGFGGFFGSILRYLIGLIPLKNDSTFPLKTLIINVVGAFVLSLIVSLAAKNPAVSNRILLMLKVGLCGGFTTFSTFAYEAGNLFSSGKWTIALLYIIMSVTLGVLACFLATMVVE